MADPSEHELPGIPGSYGGAPPPPQLGPAPARGGLFARLDGRPITGNDQQPGTPTVMVLSGWGARAGAAMLDSLILLLPRLLLIGALALPGVFLCHRVLPLLELGGRRGDVRDQPLVQRRH